MNKVKIALVQMTSLINDTKGNINKMEGFIKTCANNDGNIICFPELSIHGYSRSSLTQIGYSSIKEQLTDLSHRYNVTIISGVVEAIEDKHYNTMLINHPDKTINTYRKTHLGQYEQRIFERGDSLSVYVSNTIMTVIPFGIQICYDMHFPESTTTLALKGAKIIFAPHASPMAGEKRLEIWKKYMSTRAYDNRVYIAACNQVGYNGEKSFGGGLGVWDPEGNLIDYSVSDLENLLFVEIDLDFVDNIKNGIYGHMRTPNFLKDRRPELYL